MEVVEVDVVGSKPLERALDRLVDGRRRPVAGLAAPPELRREHDPVATTLEDLAEEALAPATAAVALRRVEEGDPHVERRVDHGPRCREVEAPAEVVAAQTDA